MKTRLMTGIAAAGLAAVAQAQMAPGGNSVGFVPVTIPPAGGFVIAGVNVQQIGGQGMIGVVRLLGSNQLVRANNPQFATQILIWSPASQSYVGMYQRLDGRYRRLTGEFGDYQLSVGDAIILQSPSTSTAPHTIYLAGEVLSGEAALRTVPPGLSLMANPFFGAWHLNSTSMTWVADGAKAGTASTADRIHLLSESGFVPYYLRSAGQRWVRASDNVVLSSPIPIGSGFWYEARGTSYVSRIPRVTLP